MGQLLLCIDQLDLKDLFKVHFSPHQSVELIFADDTDGLEKYFSLFPDITAVVTVATYKEIQTAKKIDSILCEQNKECDFYVIGPTQDKELKTSHHHFRLEEHQKMIADLKVKFGISESGSAEEIKSDFVSMPSHLFLHFNTLPFDLYLKLSRDGVDKFVKRIPAQENYSHDTLENYISKGASEFYFEKQYIKNFSKLLVDQLEGRIGTSTSVLSDQLQVESEVFHSSKDIINSLGLKPKVVSICEMAIKNIHDRLKEEKNLKNFLQSLNDKPNLQYQYSFVSITSLICSQILDQKELPQLKKDEFSLRLVFASYFSDISLSNEVFMKCRTDEELMKLNKEEQIHIGKHAQKSAELISTYPLIPADVVKIVQQHHGSLNGIGFPATPAASISPLTSILMVAQEFSHVILQSKNLKLSGILDQVDAKFKGTTCEGATKELINSFK